MQIRQALVMASPVGDVGDLSVFEELGLQICRSSCPDTLKSLSCMEGKDLHDSILVSTSDFESLDGGLALLHQAVDVGLPVIFNSDRQVIEELQRTGNLSPGTRESLASRALYLCIQADAKRLSKLQGALFPRYLVSCQEKVQDLRYGENWHQKAALYRRPGGIGLHIASKLGGKEMSYNNVVDAEAAVEMLLDLSQYDGHPFDRPLAAIVKHANPCGIAYGRDLEQAYRWAFATDPKSAFGGVIGFSCPVDVATAMAIGDSFVEVILAPGFEPEALEILTAKPNRRILDLGDLLKRKDELYSTFYSKTVFGGILVQEYDTGDIKEWRVVTERAPSAEEVKALRFAWKVSKFVKSNALVYTTMDRTIGIGSGQVSRVDSARFGALKALEHGLSTKGTVAATDSFFPFRDGLDMVHRAGATAVVHPGGSIRDAEVISAANEHGMAMVFTGMRHFKH